MRIGEIAARTGASTRALRYYERKGLLATSRTGGLQRVHAENDVERVRLIRSLLSACLLSKVIAGTVLPCIESASALHSHEAWDRMLLERERIAEEIAGLRQTHDALSALVDYPAAYMDEYGQSVS